MTRLLVASALVGWIGLTLLLAELRWFSRTPLAERLAPYVPGAWAPGERGCCRWSPSRRPSHPSPAASASGRVPAVASPSRWSGGCGGCTRRWTPPGSGCASSAGHSVRSASACCSSSPSARPAAVVVLVLLGAPVLAFLLQSSRWWGPASAGSDGSTWSCRSSPSNSGCCWAPAGRSSVRWTGSPAAATAQSPATSSASWPGSGRAGPRPMPCVSGPTLADVDAVERLVAVLALDREATDLASPDRRGGPLHPP